VEQGRLAYRVRTAEANDAPALRDAISSTLAHPDHQGRRESYLGAASRGDILVLERFERASQQWQVAGFIECHLRVDDNLSIHDVGTTGDEPQTGVVRYLLDQAFNSFRPGEAQVKIRRDATAWLEIFRNIPSSRPLVDHSSAGLACRLRLLLRLRGRRMVPSSPDLAQPARQCRADRGRVTAVVQYAAVAHVRPARVVPADRLIADRARANHGSGRIRSTLRGGGA
jgi:hypothetical protein